MNNSLIIFPLHAFNDRYLSLCFYQRESVGLSSECVVGFHSMSNLAHPNNRIGNGNRIPLN